MKWTEPKLEKLDERKFAFGQNCINGDGEDGNCYNGTGPAAGGGDCKNGDGAGGTCTTGVGGTP